MTRHPARTAALLDTFSRDGWSDPFHARFYALLDEAPGEVPALVMDGPGRGLHGAHFLGEAVSDLPPEAVPGVVERALAALTLQGARRRKTFFRASRWSSRASSIRTSRGSSTNE